MDQIKRPQLYPYMGRFTLLFLLILGLSALGSPLFLPEFILFKGTFIEFLKKLVIGIPGIVTQMLVFSLIFFWWLRKPKGKNE